MKAKRFYIDDKNGEAVTRVSDGFKSLTKAREIARYFVKSPRYDLRIYSTGGERGSGSWGEGYVGLLKDYKTYYYENEQGYKFLLKKDGTLGKALN